MVGPPVVVMVMLVPQVDLTTDGLEELHITEEGDSKRKQPAIEQQQQQQLEDTPDSAPTQLDFTPCLPDTAPIDEVEGGVLTKVAIQKTTVVSSTGDNGVMSQTVMETTTTKIAADGELKTEVTTTETTTQSPDAGERLTEPLTEPQTEEIVAATSVEVSESHATSSHALVVDNETKSEVTEESVVKKVEAEGVETVAPSAELAPVEASPSKEQASVEAPPSEEQMSMEVPPVEIVMAAEVNADDVEAVPQEAERGES